MRRSSCCCRRVDSPPTLWQFVVTCGDLRLHTRLRSCLLVFTRRRPQGYVCIICSKSSQAQSAIVISAAKIKPLLVSGADRKNATGKLHLQRDHPRANRGVGGDAHAAVNRSQHKNGFWVGPLGGDLRLIQCHVVDALFHGEGFQTLPSELPNDEAVALGGAELRDQVECRFNRRTPDIRGGNLPLGSAAQPARTGEAPARLQLLLTRGKEG